MIKATWTGRAISDNRRLIKGKQGRMVANSAYRAFKHGMAWVLVGPEDHPVGPVSVCLRVTLPRRMDISAIIKAVGDAIQLSGAIRNDNQIDHWDVRRVGVAKGRESRIEFEIEAVTEGTP